MKLAYLWIVLSVVAVSAVGGWLTSLGIPSWYDTLVLPEIAPTGGFIGTVWTIIFILSAIAVMLIWNQRKELKNFSLVIWLLVINAILNVVWSWIFFVQHLIDWAIVEMVVLNLVTLAVIVLVWKKVRVASYLFLPYFLWVSFATFLAWQIWILN